MVEFIDIENKSRLDELIKEGVKIIDVFDAQLEELCQIRNPFLRDNPDNFQKIKKEFFTQYNKSGVFCYLSWKKVCVKILQYNFFNELHTARNKNLINIIDQHIFQQTKVAIAGLSVGSNLARLSLLQGGTEKINLADNDVIGLSNLNRILAGVQDLGRKKVEVLAEYLYEMNPYAQLGIFSSGVTQDNIEDFVRIDGELVDIIIEEVDDIKVKIELRQMADKYKIPVISITDNGDGVIADIELYGKDYTINDFNIRLSKFPPFTEVKNLSIGDKTKLIAKFIGPEWIDYWMLDSAREVGSKLYSWPQLGGAAVMSGVVGSFLIRAIISGRITVSGRFAISLSDIFKTINQEELKHKEGLIKFFS